MEKKFKNAFERKWNKYFPGTDLPIGFYYTDIKEEKSMLKPPKGHRCIIADLASVRKGNTRCFDVNTIGCGGGSAYFQLNPRSPKRVRCNSVRCAINRLKSPTLNA